MYAGGVILDRSCVAEVTAVAGGFTGSAEQVCIARLWQRAYQPLN